MTVPVGDFDPQRAAGLDADQVLRDQVGAVGGLQLDIEGVVGIERGRSGSADELLSEGAADQARVGDGELAKVHGRDCSRVRQAEGEVERLGSRSTRLPTVWPPRPSSGHCSS